MISHKAMLATCVSLILSAGTLSAFESKIIEEIPTPWEGFGYNQWGWPRESDGNTFKPWDEDLWNVTKDRILAIRPSLVRLPLMRDWFNTDDNGNRLPVGTYNWDSKYMLAYFKIMDLYKENDIKVMSGFWHVSFSGQNDNDNKFYTSDECARLQGDLIEYLFKNKGYDKIITSYAPSNEPLGCSISYDDWSTMIKKLHAELEHRGLPTNILSGADSWGDWIWRPAQANATELSYYDYHCYLNDTPDDTYNQLYSRTIESNLAGNLKNIQKYDKSNKPVHVSEMAPIGVGYIDWPVVSAPAHCRIDTYEYALGFWDYGIQLARSGMSSGLAWALDGLEQNKNAGMWNNAGTYGGMTLRPWYYTWQLMCRYFPRNGKILKMSELENRKDIRILGERIGTDDYSFVVINRRMDAQSKTHSVTFKTASGKTVYIYRFGRNHCGNGISTTLPHETAATILSDGVTVEVPMEEGELITTLPPLETNRAETTSLNLDFESENGYMLIADNSMGVSSYRGANPRTTDPNTSENVANTTIQISREYEPRDCFSLIALPEYVPLNEDTPYLNIQLYRIRTAKVAIGLRFCDDTNTYLSEFDLARRKWENVQLDLTPYTGKTIEQILIYPYRNSEPSNSDSETLVFDNITFSTTKNNPLPLQAIALNDNMWCRNILDIDFEFQNYYSILHPNSTSVTTSISGNPKSQEINLSDKVAKMNIMTNDASQNLSARLSLYPYVKIPENYSTLSFSCYRQTGAAEFKIVLNLQSGEKIEEHFNCVENRLWTNFLMDLKQYAGNIITSIDIHPNTGYASLSGKLDTAYFDDFTFTNKDMSGIRNIADNSISVMSEPGMIVINGAAGLPMRLYSANGCLLRAEKINGDTYSIPAEKGIQIVVIDSKAYKTIIK